MNRSITSLLALLIGLQLVAYRASGTALYINDSSNPANIFVGTTDGTDLSVLVPGASVPADSSGRAIAIDPYGGVVYFSRTASEKNVFRYNLDGSALAEIDLGLPNRTIIDIEIDHLAGKLYFVADQSGGDPVIFRSDLDGGNVEELLSAPNAAEGWDPESIALDLTSGHLYFFDRGSHHPPSGQLFGPGTTAIRRSNLDGSGLELVVDLGLSKGTFQGGSSADIEIDTSTGYLYWTDRGTASIQRIKTDGTGIATLVSDAGVLMLALDPAQNRMYWTADGVYAANLDGSAVEMISQHYLSPNGAYGIALGPDNWTPCPEPCQIYQTHPANEVPEPAILALLAIGLPTIGRSARHKA